MDAQIAHRLQAEEHANEQCQSFQTDRQTNQLAQCPLRQNRQHQSSGQVRSTRYSSHIQAEINLEYDKIGKQSTRDWYP